MPPTIWIDGQYRDGASATVSVYDHGLLYGDGVFEGIRAYKRRVFRLQQHLDRLYASAKGIWLEIPMAKDAMGRLVEEAVRKSGLEDAYIRLVVTRGAGDLGLDPRKCPKPSIILIVDEIHLWPADRYDKGLTALTAATPIGHRESLSPRIKSLNYLAHILAKVEGIAAGVDEVLMLDPGGYVAEASGMNLFVVMNGTIRTPPTSGSSRASRATRSSSWPATRTTPSRSCPSTATTSTPRTRSSSPAPPPKSWACPSWMPARSARACRAPSPEICRNGSRR